VGRRARNVPRPPPRALPRSPRSRAPPRHVAVNWVAAVVQACLSRSWLRLFRRPWRALGSIWRLEGRARGQDEAAGVADSLERIRRGSSRRSASAAKPPLQRSGVLLHVRASPSDVPAASEPTLRHCVGKPGAESVEHFSDGPQTVRGSRAERCSCAPQHQRAVHGKAPRPASRKPRERGPEATGARSRHTPCRARSRASSRAAESPAPRRRHAHSRRYFRVERGGGGGYRAY